MDIQVRNTHESRGISEQVAVEYFKARSYKEIQTVRWTRNTVSGDLE
jgi:hypothetical protein